MGCETACAMEEECFMAEAAPAAPVLERKSSGIRMFQDKVAKTAKAVSSAVRSAAPSLKRANSGGGGGAVPVRDAASATAKEGTAPEEKQKDESTEKKDEPVSPTHKED